MQKVKSSNLEALGYVEADSSLIVHFKNGTAYKYADVPHSEYDELLKADSVGKQFNTAIKPHYEAEKLDNWRL